MGKLELEVREASYTEAGLGGSHVFASSVAMSLWLLSHRQLLQGKRVLELGAGCGLVGIACSQVGCKEIVLTDTANANVLGSSAGGELIKNLEENVK